MEETLSPHMRDMLVQWYRVSYVHEFRELLVRAMARLQELEILAQDISDSDSSSEEEEKEEYQRLLLELDEVNIRNEMEGNKCIAQQSDCTLGCFTVKVLNKKKMQLSPNHKSEDCFQI